MIRDFRYIIKRIIIGVGIALVLGLLRGNLLIGVNALEINSYNTGGAVGNVNSQTTGFGFNVSGNPWSNWGPGYLYFNFSLSKYSGSSTSTIVTPRSAYATSGGNSYVCSIGTTSNNNSTWNTLVYSARCPMTMESDGLTYIYVRLFDSNTGADIGSYEYSIAGQMTYEQATNVDVNVDTSGTTNAINNQINNDNQNTQNIINSQNNTTNAVNDVNDTLNDDDVTEANNEITVFFNDFDSGNTGTLTDIISLPLNFLNNLNNSCSPLVLPLPFLNENLTIPCISTYLSQFVPSSLLNLIKLLINGFLCYRIISSFIIYINHLKDPNNDDLEVMDL